MRWTRCGAVLATAAGMAIAPWATAMDDGSGPRIRAVERIQLRDAARGHLGVGLQRLTPELRLHFGAPEHAGVLVASVEADSPAAAAGIEVGDVLVEIGGEAVATSWDARYEIGRNLGKSVEIELRRDGRAVNVTATPEERAGIRAFRLEALPGCGRGGRLEVDDLEELGDCLAAHLEAVPWGEISAEIDDSVKSALRFAPHFELHRGRGDGDELEKRMEELEKRLEELARKLGER